MKSEGNIAGSSVSGVLVCIAGRYCSNTDDHKEIPNEKNNRDLNPENAQVNESFQSLKMLVQISNIYASCM